VRSSRAKRDTDRRTGEATALTLVSSRLAAPMFSLSVIKLVGLLSVWRMVITVATGKRHMTSWQFSGVNSLLVLLDANALMMPFQFSVDIEGELTRLLGKYEIAVPSSVLEELRRLARTKREARAALRLAERYTVIQTTGRRDPALLKLARELGAAVLTNDKRLREQLRSAGIPVIFLRGRSQLDGEGLPLR
jgi:rRNA-processing protein FCF1